MFYCFVIMAFWEEQRPVWSQANYPFRMATLPAGVSQNDYRTIPLPTNVGTGAPVVLMDTHRILWQPCPAEGATARVIHFMY